MHLTSLFISIVFAIAGLVMVVAGNWEGAAIFLVAAVATGYSAWDLLRERKRKRVQLELRERVKEMKENLKAAEGSGKRDPAQD